MGPPCATLSRGNSTLALLFEEELAFLVVLPTAPMEVFDVAVDDDVVDVVTSAGDEGVPLAGCDARF